MRAVMSAVAIGVLVVLVALLGWTLAHRNPGADFVNAVDAQKRPAAPAIDLPRLSGPGRVDLTALRGHPVVINFWASWCVACRGEASDLDAAFTTFAPKGVDFLGIDTKDDPAAARAFARRYGMRYTLAHDTGSIKDRYGVNLLPGTFVVDADGHVVTYINGTVDFERLTTVLGTLGVQ